MPGTRRSPTQINRSNGKVVPVTAPVSATPVHHSRAHPSWFIMAVGLGFLVLFVIALITQVQTNEAFITGTGQVSIFRPNWDILMQIPNLFMGNLDTKEAISAVFGWGIELIYLGFIVGYEAMHDSVYQTGQFMGGLFRTGSVMTVLFNGWSDFMYGTLGSGIGGHLSFAFMQSFIVGFFGTIGWFFIRYGWSRA